jgi:hypothetical protein
VLLSIAVRVTNAIAIRPLAADCNSPAPKASGDGTGLANPKPCAPPGLANIATQWIGWAKWGCLVCGALGLLIAAGMMMIGRRNRSHLAGEGASGIPWVVAGLSLAALAVPIATQVLTAAGN